MREIKIILKEDREDFKSGKTVDEIETEVRKELRTIKQYI